MAKVFTITEGLENLGAIKSGGQGSVYKTRKKGEIITAIKILPTPLSGDTEHDKNFASFQNEVEKLKKVNEEPNPNIVSIIDSGITSSGNFPYIEMEYIEGPDLGELLKPPFDPVFTIKETIKVAEHLANALAHCHGAGIKHGDIKSNNVKFNRHTGNYVLLDFGLSVMSDEQRRTSIRYAGAIEFMAPEQSNGEMLFETDIYSLGIILFELLTGTVPFPLASKGEMARNSVMLAHLEKAPPDIITLRRSMLPDSWSDHKKEREMQVPVWLVGMICKCLEKVPSKRFSNGTVLQEFVHHAISMDYPGQVITNPSAALVNNSHDPAQEAAIKQLQLQLIKNEELLADLQEQVRIKDKELYEARYAGQYAQSKPRGVSKTSFTLLLILALGMAGYAGYNNFYKPSAAAKTNKFTAAASAPTTNADSLAATPVKPNKKFSPKILKKKTADSNAKEYPKATAAAKDSLDGHTATSGNEYEIRSIAYFYNQPDKYTRRNVFLTRGNATLLVLNEKNDFVFVSHRSADGKVTKGWLLKKDIVAVNEY
ncbi:MAG: serine/threonine-protein kinase [Ferruginibacter sp.]